MSKFEYNFDTLNNLLRVKLLKNATLYKNHDFTIDEVAILKEMTTAYVGGQMSLEISDLIEEVFSVRGLSNKLEKIEIIKSLVKKGVVEIGSTNIFAFEPNNRAVENQPLLDILHSSLSLSHKFLYILEGRIQEETKEIDAYKNNFEFIEDKLQKVYLYMDKRDRTILEAEVKKLDEKIAKRLENSDIEFPLQKIIEEKELSKNEEVILLAVLSEEYSFFANVRSLRSVDNLIELVSLERYEKFENRALFRENSKLIKSGLFELETSVHFVNEQKSFSNEEIYITDEVLHTIEGGKKVKRENKRKILQKLVDEGELFELITPKNSLEDVVLTKKSRETLNTIVKQLDKRVVERLYEWGIRDRKKGVDARIIFHGVPGTGKTMTAVALAKTLKKEVLHFDCSKILSMYVGESEKNVRNIFDSYKEIVKESGVEPVLLLNEADQFLTARSTDTASSISQMYNQMQNIFLEQIENFEGVLVATTNLLENLDKAFSRRFNYKVEFKPPTEKERIEIWKKHLPEKAPFEKDFSVEKLAKYKLTGGQIDLIVKNTAFHVATEEKPLFTESAFIKEIDREKKSGFENEQVMGFLVNR
jgi:SpoVK/Ycf46/Vps4 family AAA+-type ATPase